MGVLSALLGDTISDTFGHCRECEALVPAKVIVRGGAVWLERRCPRHGTSRALQSRHPRYYRLIETLLPRIPDVALEQDITSARNLRGVFIDVTEKCNLQCPNCLTNANEPQSTAPPELPEVMIALGRLLPARPVIYLTGGEPTLRPDIVEWVATLSRAGYDVKLLTNGLTLRDTKFCEALRDAGVRWVLLQFDTLDDASLRALRGRGGLPEVRRTAIENLSRLGVSMDLACMIDREHNFPDMGELLRLGFRTPGVRHVSFMPSRRIGRGLLTTDDNLLDELEMMDGIEEQTGGAIKRRDWVLFLAAMSAVYRATGAPDFAPRRCFLPLPLLGTAERFVPATRATAYLRDPRNALALLKMAGKAGRIESARWTERSLLTSIETFREPDSIDVGDASRCSRYYLVDGKVRQACLYNVVSRPTLREQRNAEARPGKRFRVLP